MARQKTKKKTRLRTSALISGSFVVLLFLVFLFFCISRSLFKYNMHFKLKHIEVKSKGWWNAKNKKLLQVLNKKDDLSELKITPHAINLFELDLPALRSKLLKQEPSIEKAIISKKLPDTLTIKIFERIPRAFLHSRKSPWVVDQSGIVMSRKKCINLDKNLPYIRLGNNAIIKPGRAMPETAPAMRLIMLTKREYPSIKIAVVKIRPKDMVFVFFYRGVLEKRYIAYIPKKNIKEKLHILKAALNQRKLPYKEVDLRYEEPVNRRL